jgi:hypothetical protein
MMSLPAFSPTDFATFYQIRSAGSELKTSLKIKRDANILKLIKITDEA